METTIDIRKRIQRHIDYADDKLLRMIDALVDVYESDNSNTDIAQWEKNFIDERLQIVNEHPERLHPIQKLFE